MEGEASKNLLKRGSHSAGAQVVTIRDTSSGTSLRQTIPLKTKLLIRGSVRRKKTHFPCILAPIYLEEGDAQASATEVMRIGSEGRTT